MTDLRERVADLVRFNKDPNAIAEAAIAIVLEEAAKVAGTHGVYPELNIYNGGPDWYRHGQEIAAAIRALKEKP